MCVHCRVLSGPLVGSGRVAAQCSGMPKRDGTGCGRDAPREGMYVYMWLSHVVQRKLTHIVKQLCSNFKKDMHFWKTKVCNIHHTSDGSMASVFI